MKGIITAAGSIGVLMTAAPAVGQEAPNEPPTGEIVVTAQKRSERLLDVPMSINVATGETLKAAGIQSTADLQQISPGLVAANSGAFAFTPTVRGISSSGTSPGDEANVSVYLDDVYIGAPLAGLFDLKNIERIEVLQGPQGTLFGRNSTGGAIRVVTRAPSFTPEGELSADYGFDFNELRVGGYVSGPLSEKVAASVSANYVNNDGYVKGISVNEGKRFARSDNWNVRAKLLFRLADNFEATIAGDYSNRDDDAVYAVVPVGDQNSSRSVPGAVLAGPLEYSGSTAPVAKVKSRGLSLDMTWDTFAVTIRSITAYRRANGVYQTDRDRINVPGGAAGFGQGQKTFSQELNFSGPSTGTLAWIAGLYYYSSDAYVSNFDSYIGDAPSGAISSSFASDVKTKSYAGFGELTLNATERLHFTLGGRYSSEKKELNFRDLIRAAGLRTGADEHSWDSVTYRAVARYEIADDSNIYASVSSGFKSGVYNSYAFPINRVDPEKITAFEIGAKAKIGEIRLSAAAFHYNYSDIQVQAQNNQNNVLVISLQNAAKASVTGYEGSIAGPIGDHFDFNLGFSALPNAKYDDFTAAQIYFSNATGGATSIVPFDASGSRIVRAPKFQGNARIGYKQELFSGMLRANLSYSYRSGFYWQAANSVHEPSNGILNTKLSWTDPADKLTYSVWAENLTNEKYSMYTTIGTIGVSAAYAKPRLIGVGVDYQF